MIIVIIISLIGHVNCVGKRYIYWNGPEPRLCLTETELIKEFLSKYSTVSGKSWLQKQGSKHFIGEGVLMANGENWYHQRHIVAPAFMGNRLKVLFNHTHHEFGLTSVRNSNVNAIITSVIVGSRSNGTESKYILIFFKQLNTKFEILTV